MPQSFSHSLCHRAFHYCLCSALFHHAFYFHNYISFSCDIIQKRVTERWMACRYAVELLSLMWLLTYRNFFSLRFPQKTSLASVCHFNRSWISHRYCAVSSMELSHASAILSGGTKIPVPVQVSHRQDSLPGKLHF